MLPKTCPNFAVVRRSLALSAWVNLLLVGGGRGNTIVDMMAKENTGNRYNRKVANRQDEQEGGGKENG